MDLSHQDATGQGAAFRPHGARMLQYHHGLNLGFHLRRFYGDIRKHISGEDGAVTTDFVVAAS